MQGIESRDTGGSVVRQVDEFGFKVCGAGGDELFDGHDLAIEAWGRERAEDENGGLIAMAYLWRRFGPPWRGGDDHKSLVDYTLTTEDPQIFLWLHLGGSGLAYSVGYLAHESIREEADRPMADWCKRYEDWWRAAIGESPDRTNPREWRTAGGLVYRVNRAVLDALRELERPVYVRDCALNLFGRCKDTYEPAERSLYAGYGVPKESMDKLVEDDNGLADEHAYSAPGRDT